MAKGKKGYEELVWAISGLTELIGQAFVSSADEGRSFHWADDDGYWFSLNIKKGTNEIYAEIGDNQYGKHKEMYAVLGYCQYHGIRHEGVGENG